MKTIVAYFLGMIALVTFAGGAPVYADALEAEAFSIAPGPGTNGLESLDDGHCAFYSDGADNCVVNVPPEVNMQPEAVDQSAVSKPDPTDSALAVRFRDAIPVAVIQMVTIAAAGDDAADREETSSAQPIPVAATEPALDDDAKTTTGATVEPTGESADAIEVAIVQSVTVEVPGQDASGESVPAQLAPPSTAPRSLREAKNDGHDNPQ